MTYEKCPASGKSQFHTRRKALRFAEQRWQRDHVIVEVYQCRSCNLWHTTTKVFKR